MPRHNRSLTFFLGLLGAVSIGCGSKYDVVSIKGKLTCDGQPVPGMIIMFQPTEGRTSEAITADDGSFEMGYSFDQMGVEVDSHKVVISWSPPTDDGKSRPSEIQKKVVADFKANGPLELKIEQAQSDLEIKLPRG